MATTEFLHAIESVCPECLETVSGRLFRQQNQIMLEKQCPTHGRFTATIWRGEPSFDSWVRPKLPFSGGIRRTVGQGCPYDCGLCENHTQRTCTALIEITSRCNLHCPVCFADSGGCATDQDLATLGRTLRQTMASTGGCNLQLSGGEPTVREDLVEIVSLAKEIGFTFIQLNSNGLKLAEKPELATQLRDAGLSSVFLQFDGISDSVYTTLRGRDLFDIKCQAINNIAAAGLGIVLVPTVVPGVNTDQLWKIVQFGLARQPQVRGVHFQPISYFGRFPKHFSPDHFTLPEIMQALEKDSGALVQAGDFNPPGCEHALCSFSARYLIQEDGSLQRLGAKTSCNCAPKPAEEGALNSIEATARQWGAVPPLPANNNETDDDLSRFLHRAKTHTFQISAMAFQDAWSLNLERLRGCCIHVAQEDGRLIPFCSFNLTSRNGQSLHRKPAANHITRVTKSPVDQLVGRKLGLKETANRRELEEAQMAALRQTLRYALTGSSLYRKRLIELDPDSLKTQKDLGKIPFLVSEDIINHGPGLLNVSQSQVARVVTLQTSGSTGPPKRLMFTSEDLSTTIDFFYNGMHSLIGDDDRVLVLLPFEQPDSVGHLLLRALNDGGITAIGLWPPGPDADDLIKTKMLTCAVGLPQHLLALAEKIEPGLLRSMLLCSDYASPALRLRIENACGCETFLHYGTTESGLGGAVECQEHQGCHIRESDLLVEIIDPETGENLPDGQLGEVVITTLGRQAMVLLRYRTGDLARIDRSTCACGGITARLYDIRGRLINYRLNNGSLCSQDLDDSLFQIPGLLDYRATLDRLEKDRLNITYLTSSAMPQVDEEIAQHLIQIPVIRSNHASGNLILGTIQHVKHFTASHTVKRTILDLRRKGERDATCS